MNKFTFYSIGTDKDGQQQVIGSTELVRIQAEKDILTTAAEKKLYVDVDAIRKVRHVGKQDGTITKFYKYRKSNGGNNPKSYDKAL